LLQAEDFTRDCHVTGVQTCALPIYSAFTPDPSCLQRVLRRIEPETSQALAHCLTPNPTHGRKSHVNPVFTARNWGVHCAATGWKDRKSVVEGCSADLV